MTKLVLKVKKIGVFIDMQVTHAVCTSIPSQLLAFWLLNCVLITSHMFSFLFGPEESKCQILKTLDFALLDNRTVFHFTPVLNELGPRDASVISGSGL